MTKHKIGLGLLAGITPKEKRVYTDHRRGVN